MVQKKPNGDDVDKKTPFAIEYRCGLATAPNKQREVIQGKSSLMIYEKFPELRYKYRNREFWCRGYYVDTAGKNAKKIAEYIKHQLDEDKAGEQLTMGNF